MCSHYDASDDIVIRSGADLCLERTEFDDTADIYGCCTRALANEPPQWIVQMSGVDESGDDSGPVLIRVSAPTNELEGGCRQYDLVIRL